MNESMFHELANIFPLMEGKAFEDLTEDIRTRGLREPIWLYEHQILDGRNRYRACLAAGIEPVFLYYQDDDPVGFVVSCNLHRRHLSEPQREMAAAKIATMKNGGDRRSEQSANWQTETTVAMAAELLNVSERSVARAKNVINNGTPELTSQVESGNIRVSTAADIATLPPNQQDIIVGLGEKAILMAAREIRSKKAVIRQQENERIRREALAIPPPEGRYRCIVYFQNVAQ